MPKINMTAWKHKVSHACLHALMKWRITAIPAMIAARISRITGADWRLFAEIDEVGSFR